MTVIARVALDQPLAHLDRLFDYSVGEDLIDSAVVGARVQVRFAGRRLDGWIVELADSSPFEKLLPLLKVVSAEPLMRPELVKLIRAVADHYSGTFSDVMRLAVPPRHARTEAAQQQPWPDPVCEEPAVVLPRYPTGESFLSALERGRSPRAYWQVAPVHGGVGDWAKGFAEAVAATCRAGGSALLLVPDERDLDILHAELATRFSARSVGLLHNGLGPSRRYRNYLAATRGAARILVGTRSAVFTPLPDLKLIAMWDDGDDLYGELKAPYPHAREVAAIRTLQQHNALLIAGRGRSVQVEDWLEKGWMAPIELPVSALRASCPVVRVSGDSLQEQRRDPLASRVRLPSSAFDVLRTGLSQGPVLVQVPRVGYVVALSCDRCRTSARCPECLGPLRKNSSEAVLECAWCGRLHPNWACSVCGESRLRSPKVGAARTAEELAKAFPGTLAINSSGDQVRKEVPDKSAIVVATPGGEPVAPGGYAAGLLLDTDVLLSRPSLGAEEEALRLWLNAVALVRPAAEGGTVIAVGDPSALQPLVRMAPGVLARRNLSDRQESGFPPAAKLVQLSGPRSAIDDFLGLDDWSDFDLIGPAASGEEWTLLVRTAADRGTQLVTRVKTALAQRSAHKRVGSLRVQIDPWEVG